MLRLLSPVLAAFLLGGAVLQAGEPAEIAVPAHVAWTDTGMELRANQRVSVRARGSIYPLGGRLVSWFGGPAMERAVGPEGTYVWPQPYHGSGRAFPLPAMADGPHPAFCLIGKIGSGPPFYIGRDYAGVAAVSGRLWLGINDDQAADNDGAFTATVTLDPASAAAPARPPPQALPVIRPGSTGKPVPRARVLLLYVDGLRLDVLRELAAAGFLPHFSAAFLDHGLLVPDAFTVFPSNTLIANGSLFTGLFPDRTGIKSQNQFERPTLKPRSHLSAWLPDRFMPRPRTRVLNLLDKYAPEQTHAFLVKRGVVTLAGRLGKRFAYTALPIAPLNPPPAWLHSAINTLGPFNLGARLPARVDEVHAQYAIEHLLGDPDARIIAVWFPMVDKTSHHSGRGQFGAARRDLALADRLLGRMRQRLREVGWEQTTYLVLVSDHGHLGGEEGVNQACHLPRDWAHAQLGCNARVVGQEWTHPGLERDRGIFFDNQGAGQAAVFLPYGSYTTGPWRRNRLVELTHYAVHPFLRGLDLLASLRAFRPPGWDGRGAGPVDLILVKLDAQRVFLYRDEERQAILHREPHGALEERYRYEPVRRLTQSADGALHYDPPAAGQDPLGYLQDPGFSHRRTPQWLTEPHPAQEWLAATAKTRYPDAVVAMSTFFSWRASLADLAEARDPDLVVTAAPGWSFRSDDEEGTDHGSPLAESMRMTLVLAGPNIPHGELAEPHRIVDVMPTLLEMIGWPYDPASLDGRAITGIYE